MPTYQIYRIQTFDEGSNSYITARDQRWVTRLDSEFNNLQEAREYIEEKSRQHTDLPIFLDTHRKTILNDPNACSLEDFIEKFLFTEDKYLKYRRFFIGKPPLKLIQKALEADGIRCMKI
jgi:hypothetical protein